MDELDRTLSELRRTVVEGARRVVADHRIQELAPPKVIGWHQPETVVSSGGGKDLVGSGEAAVPQPQPVSDPGPIADRERGAAPVPRTAWERARLPLLAFLTAVLTFLLL